MPNKLAKKLYWRCQTGWLLFPILCFVPWNLWKVLKPSSPLRIGMFGGHNKSQKSLSRHFTHCDTVCHWRWIMLLTVHIRTSNDSGRFKTLWVCVGVMDFPICHTCIKIPVTSLMGWTYNYASWVFNTLSLYPPKVSANINQNLRIHALLLLELHILEKKYVLFFECCLDKLWVDIKKQFPVYINFTAICKFAINIVYQNNYWVCNLINAFHFLWLKCSHCVKMLNQLNQMI